jgi:hypothetical protein
MVGAEITLAQKILVFYGSNLVGISQCSRWPSAVFAGGAKQPGHA